MNQNNRVSPPAFIVVPDLGLELMHWRRNYPDAPCFKSSLQFERYAATFKFGYDTFLANHTKSEDELCPSLCHQYKDGVAACDRIDWAEAQMIVAATWERLRSFDPPPDAIGEPIRPLAGDTAHIPPSRSKRWNWLVMRQKKALHTASTRLRQAAAL